MHSGQRAGSGRPRDGRARRATAWCVLGVFLGTLPGAPPAFAAPEGERVVHGEAQFERNGNDTTITTRTRETIVDYDRFDIGVEEKVRIDQPDSRSKILNRVPYGDASRIDGGLSSNGIVYILNPSGVFLGDRAIVDVGGLVAGAGNLSNQDFLAGIDRFTEVNGEIGVAEGATVRSAGDVALIGRRVENLGSILAEAGMIAIVAGSRVVLAPLDGHVAIHVDGPADPPAAEAGYALTQAGTLEAQRVTLSAGDTYSLAMNHTGVTRAQEIHVEAGGDGLVQVAGELDASSAEGAGGKIRVLGGKIALMDASLDASGATGGGEIRVGGDVRGGGGVPTARRLYVGPEAELRADATQHGDGGKIVMYSRERTAFQGSLSARGGAEGGDGGFAEISGAQLESSGEIALGAPAGNAGTLLYDPDVIQIQGGVPAGAQDGSDDPDASGTTLAQSGAGQVLFDDTGAGGAGTGLVPFVIHESEIEGTDANIILEAVNYIYASGDFGDDVVVLMPERSLTLRTTGTTAPATAQPLGIDLVTNTAEGEALEWRVSEGGRITLATSLETLAAPPVDAPKASIKAGALVATGLNYPELPPEAEPGTLRTPDVTEIFEEIDAISVTTARGDIDVARISADGEDSQAGRVASPGRRINVRTEQGDVVVDRISAVGGGATAAQATRGEFGGQVSVSAGGNATIGAGGIDVSGGVGMAGAQIGTVLLLDGGDGGVIQVTTNGADTLLLVQGDLTARGGDGQGSFDPEEPEDDDPVAEIVEADGGLGGAVQLVADSDLTVEAVTIDTSGGDGTGSGGGDVALLEQIPTAIQIVGGRGDTPNAGDVRVDALLRADGGNAHTAFAGAAAPEIGGAGGRAGSIEVQANGGKLLAANMQIEASGGVGRVGVDDEGVPLVDDQSRLVGAGGGNTSTLSLSARDEVVVGDILARGGEGINATGGRGGSVTIESAQSSVTLAGDIDLNGGDASLPDVPATAEVAVDGGLGGTLTVSTEKAPASAEDEAANVGDIFLAGVVGGQGGAGIDLEGDATRAAGVSMRIDALGDIELGAGAPAGARFTGGNVDLEARNIGSAAPIGIAGTVGTDDIARLTASGTVQASIDPTLAPAAQTTLERVDVQITNVAGHAELFRGAQTIAESIAATDTTPHTLAQLGRDVDEDPTLGYRLDATVTGTTPQPVLRVAENGVRLGTAGGEIANGGFGTAANPVAENRGAIEAAGPGVLGTTRGTLRLEGSTLGAETDTRTPLRFAGDDGAALRLDAEGDVHVDVEDGAPFGAIDVIQRGALANVTMNLQAGDHVTVVARDDNPAENVLAAVHALDADTTASGSAFAYKVDAGATNVQVDVDAVRLGGTGLLSTTGDLVLTDAEGASPAISTNGHDLSLISRRGGIRQESPSVVAIDFTGPGDPDDEDPARLALRADLPIGSATAPLRTRGLQGVAGTSFNGGFYLANAEAGPGAEDLRIERVVNLDPADLDETQTGAIAEIGVRALNGNLELSHADPDGRIVLGALRDVVEFGELHAGATGNVVLNGDIEIENARFRATQVPVLDDEGEPVEGEDGNPVFETVYLRLNDANLRSTNGDIVLNGSVDTSAASVATSEDPDFPADEFVHASLLTEAGGTVRFLGDVGKRAGDQAPLALLDTTDAAVEGPRSFEVGDARFRGTLDGPGGLEIEARDLSTSETGHEATVQFDGDVGRAQPLAGLGVDAERIAFTTADRVVTGEGGIRLDTHQTEVPQIATITDSTGGIRFSTTGTFQTGALDKLSSAGALQIAAATAHVTDLSATQLTVNAQQILIRRRAAGPVELRGDLPAVEDGPIVPSGFDEGTDIVADRIDLSSVPIVDETTIGATPRFGLGSGGIRAPGSLSGFEVVRFTAGVDSVDRSRFFGTDGRILDLTPTGNPVIGNPSQQLPRERAVTVPSLPPRFSEQAPAAPPALDSEQVLAFLRCGGALTTCDAQAAASLATLTDFEASTLATERAADLAARYRALRSRDLSAAFDAAGAGFRQASDFGEFDPQAFGSYLEATREHEPARTAIHELATVLVEIDLLGLAPEVEAQLRRDLASDLAHEANLPGFDADAVLTAVAATPIGIPAQ